MQVEELPEEGELVLATVKEVTSHGAYVTLDEYNNMTGFLHISEVATGWVRNIERFVREGQKTVLKVIRVNKARREVDLSLKQVTHEEKRRKLMEVKKEEKARSYLEMIRDKCNYTEEEMKEYIKILREEYELLYDMFEEVARKGKKAIDRLKIPEEMKDAIVEVSKNIRIPSVEVRGIMEITCLKPNGIEIIKKALTSVEGKSNDAEINITYMGSPRYRIMVKAENFKIAEKAISKAIEKIRSIINKNNGTFNFIREESKKGVT
jgi:translation initiation factor 2 subunit 1